MATIKKDRTNLWLIISAVVILIFGLCLPTGNGITEQGLWVAGIFLASLIMWAGISISWPSLITLLLLGLVPSLGFKNVFAGALGNPTTAFLIFTFALVYPLSQTNFIRRCTIAMITNPIARRSPWSLVVFLLGAVTFLGLFISPTVLMVTFTPFLLDIFKILHIKKGSPTGNMLTMGSTFSINLSSSMTPIAHVWPTLALGFFTSATKHEITQVQYMLVGIPVGLLIFIGMLLIFKFILRPNDLQHIDPKAVMKLRGSVPPADKKEKVVVATMILTVILWVFPSFIKDLWPNVYLTINNWTTAFPPLLGCIILLIARVNGQPIMNFHEVTTKGISWAPVIMVGAASEIGTALVAKPMGIQLFLTNTLGSVAKGLPEMLLVLFFVTWCIVETNFSSNIVTVTVLSSVAISVITSLPSSNPIHLGAVLILLGFGAGIANMTAAGQAGTIPVALGTEYTTAKDMMVWGLDIAILAIFLLTFIGYPLAKLIV